MTTTTHMPHAIVETPSKRVRHWRIFFGALAVAALAVFVYWLHARRFETTDDAFVEADVAPVSSKVRGQVQSIFVTDNQRVKAGYLLLEIDPADYRVRADQARAELAAARAEARRAAADAARAKTLFERDQISRQSYDRAAADADVAAANAVLSQRRLEAAELDLSYTRIVAPVAGLATRRAVEVRTYVEVGQPLMAVVPESVYVTANFKETQVGRIRPGQSVVIRVDAHPGHPFRGHVDSIQAGTGARFSLLPPENATGNYVKVVQRVPVKIVFDEPTASFLLAPGMSVVPRVEVR